jgi:hypothetical protein
MPTATVTATESATPTLAPTATTTRKTTPSTATPLPAVLAAFLGVDATTQGAWGGVYGAQGYLVASNSGNYSYSNIRYRNRQRGRYAI